MDRKATEVTEALELKIVECRKKYETLLSKMVKVEILKGGQAYIQRREVKTYINIHVKVFHGSRPTHTFRVSIYDCISVILDKICKKDGLEL